MFTHGVGQGSRPTSTWGSRSTAGRGLSLSLNRPTNSTNATNPSNYRFSGSFSRGSGSTPEPISTLTRGSFRSDTSERRPLFGFSSQGRPGFFSWGKKAKGDLAKIAEPKEIIKSKSVDDIKKEEDTKKSIDYSDEFNCEILYYE